MSKIKKVNIVMVIVHLLLIVLNTRISNWGGVINSVIWVIVHIFFVATLEQE